MGRFSPCLFVALGVGLCCSQATVSEPVLPAGETTFPAEYTSWKKVNPTTILHESEKVALDLYANELAFRRGPDGSFPAGTVLVKEERALGPDPSGRLVPKDVLRVSVMFKVHKGETSGWVFKAFDPATRQELPRDKLDPDGCYYCHADARDRDYVFSDF